MCGLTLKFKGKFGDEGLVTCQVILSDFSMSNFAFSKDSFFKHMLIHFETDLHQNFDYIINPMDEF